MTEIERLAERVDHGAALWSKMYRTPFPTRLAVKTVLTALKDGPLAKRMNARDLMFWRAALNEILGLPLLDEAV